MAASPTHKGWLRKPNFGLLAGVNIGSVGGASVTVTNTAVDGVLLGTPVTPALAANSMVISNLVASGDIMIAANLAGNSGAYLVVDASASTMYLYGQGTLAATVIAGKVTVVAGESTGDFKLNLTLTAGVDGVGADGEQLTSGGAAAECDWAAAASLREYKNLIQERTDAEDVLRTLVNTPVYDFKYKSKAESVEHIMSTGDCETVYTGVVADEAPWAMHYHGKILNPINTVGYLMLGIKALSAKVDELEARLN